MNLPSEHPAHPDNFNQTVILLLAQQLDLLKLIAFNTCVNHDQIEEVARITGMHEELSTEHTLPAFGAEDET